jgi:hypothetical protein
MIKDSSLNEKQHNESLQMQKVLPLPLLIYKFTSKEK